MKVSLRIMSPRSPGDAVSAVSPPAGAPIDRRGRSADSRRLRTHVDYAPLAETNGKLMYATARGPPEPWSRATVTAASSNHFLGSASIAP